MCLVQQFVVQKVQFGKPDTYCVVQTIFLNNYYEIDEHVNCHATLEDFSASAPMSNVLYEGELKLDKYKRFMKIGYK